MEGNEKQAKNRLSSTSSILAIWTRNLQIYFILLICYTPEERLFEMCPKGFFTNDGNLTSMKQALKILCRLTAINLMVLYNFIKLSNIEYCSKYCPKENYWTLMERDFKNFVFNLESSKSANSFWTDLCWKFVLTIIAYSINLNIFIGNLI